MKLKTVVPCALLILTGVLHADDFSLSDGREYKGVTVSRIEADGIVVISGDGVEKIPFSLLPKEVVDEYRKNFHATPAATPAEPATIQALPPGATPTDTDRQSQPGPESQNQFSPRSSPTPKTTPVPESAPSPIGVKLPIAPEELHKFRWIELAARAVVAIFVAFASLGVAWFILQRLIDYWMAWEKEKQSDSSNLREFRFAYAAFCEIRKLWDYYLEHGDNELSDSSGSELPHAARWELLRRAYEAEGTIEALFLRLTAGGKLSPGEVELLGRFRQGFQSLGEAIRNNKPLKWKDPEHTEYLAFKRLASGVEMLIAGKNPAARLGEERAEAYRVVASNQWERVWSLTNAQAKEEKR